MKANAGANSLARRIIVGALGVRFLEVRCSPRYLLLLECRWDLILLWKEAVKRGVAAKNGIVLDFWRLELSFWPLFAVLMWQSGNLALQQIKGMLVELARTSSN